MKSYTLAKPLPETTRSTLMRLVDENLLERYLKRHYRFLPKKTKLSSYRVKNRLGYRLSYDASNELPSHLHLALEKHPDCHAGRWRKQHAVRRETKPDDHPSCRLLSKREQDHLGKKPCRYLPGNQTRSIVRPVRSSRGDTIRWILRRRMVEREKQQGCISSKQVCSFSSPVHVGS